MKGLAPCTRVLARWQHHPRRHVRVLEQLQRHELVVLRRLLVLEDARKLLQVRRAEQVRHVDHRLLGQERERLGLDLDDVLAVRALDDRDVLRGQQPVRRGVLCGVFK